MKRFINWLRSLFAEKVYSFPQWDVSNVDISKPPPKPLPAVRTCNGYGPMTPESAAEHAAWKLFSAEYWRQSEERRLAMKWGIDGISYDEETRMLSVGPGFTYTAVPREREKMLPLDPPRYCG